MLSVIFLWSQHAEPRDSAAWVEERRLNNSVELASGEAAQSGREMKKLRMLVRI